MRKENDKLFKNAELQIHIDIPRMNPLVAIFQQKLVQEVSTLLSLYPACSSYLVLDIVDGNSYSTFVTLEQILLTTKQGKSNTQYFVG